MVSSDINIAYLKKIINTNKKTFQKDLRFFSLVCLGVFGRLRKICGWIYKSNFRILCDGRQIFSVTVKRESSSLRKPLLRFFCNNGATESVANRARSKRQSISKQSAKEGISAEIPS